MSKHKCNVVKAAGFLAAFNHNLFVAAKQAGVSEERLYDLLNGDADFVAKLGEVFVQSKGPGVQNLAQMIAACQFHNVNPKITEVNFPITGPVADVTDMLTLTQKDLGGQNMTTPEIEVAIDRDGYRSATPAEKFAYAKAKWNGKDFVVTLGSSLVSPFGGRYFLSMYEDGDGRKLDLCWDDPEWDGPECRWVEVCLFLVVRKQ